MNESFLNVAGVDAVIDAVRRCWASQFGARSVFYRATRGYGQADMDIAVVVQLLVASTRSGVMFTIDPSDGNADRIVIEGAFGLGEAVVSGAVSPDRYLVHKSDLTIEAREVRRKELVIEPAADGGVVRRTPEAAEAARAVLDDDEVREVAELGRRVEQHYGAPQDTEWTYDGDGRLWLLQSRPVTTGGEHPAEHEVLAKGLGAAPGLASGRVRVVLDRAGASALEPGEVLVAPMTTPDWVPLMRRAAAIVTDSGGMTCHAAIVSRELGIPCLVGTGRGTDVLRTGEEVTVDAGRGVVLAGRSAEAEPAGGGASSAGAVAGAGPGPVTATRLLQPQRAITGRAPPRPPGRRCRPAPGGAHADRGARRHASAAAPRGGAASRSSRAWPRRSSPSPQASLRAR